MPSLSSTVMNRHFIVFLPELYAYYRDFAEDAQLNAVADERMKNPDIVSVYLDDL